MNRIIYKAAALFLAAVLFTAQAKATPSVSAKSAILMDANTGTVLYAQNENAQSLIASTTKIMTAIVALESGDPNRSFVIPQEAVGIEGSSMYLRAGESLTVRELLYGLMLHSGNDAAIAVSIACAGSVDAFVLKMNQKAQQLGLVGTHFENPNGLDAETHYSTAKDLAALTRYALKNDLFSQIVATKEIRIGERCLRNHNRLLWMTEGVIGVKTGYTRAAGRILVSAAVRNGRTLIAVTICDGNDWADHNALYDYGFSLYEENVLLAKGTPVLEVTLWDGSISRLYSACNVSANSLANEPVTVKLAYPRIAYGASGQAFADVWIGDLWIKRIPLYWEAFDEGKTTENPVGAWSMLSQGSGKLDNGR